jgi:hypothetical protein
VSTPRARELLKRAARGFGAHEELARARCVVAEAEVAMAMRDFAGSPRALAAAAATLQAHADTANALQAWLITARRLLLLGRLDEAAAALAKLDARGLPPSLRAVAELTSAELALRSLRVGEARMALARAHAAAERAQVPALMAEVTEARAALDRPAARRLSPAASGRCASTRFQRCWPPTRWWSTPAAAGWAPATSGGRWRAGLCCSRWHVHSPKHGLAISAAKSLIESAFRTKRPDETHRARLRVEIGRLRALVKTLATIEATERGFILKPLAGRDVAVLAPPIDGEQASLVALLSDGAAWSTSALALALGASQRTVQRALADLEADGRVRSIGRARAQRWLAPPLAGFTTILLLPASLPIG